LSHSYRYEWNEFPVISLTYSPKMYSKFNQ
jgi:hypothetical protein